MKLTSLHTVSDVLVQAILTPSSPHAVAAVQFLHGALPESENVVPMVHATWHTVSDVLVQSVFMPTPHVDVVVHVVQGSFPVEENDVPDTHDTWLKHSKSILV